MKTTTKQILVIGGGTVTAAAIAYYLLTRRGRAAPPGRPSLSLSIAPTPGTSGGNATATGVYYDARGNPIAGVNIWLLEYHNQYDITDPLTIAPDRLFESQTPTNSSGSYTVSFTYPEVSASTVYYYVCAADDQVPSAWKG